MANKAGVRQRYYTRLCTSKDTPQQTAQGVVRATVLGDQSNVEECDFGCDVNTLYRAPIADVLSALRMTMIDSMRVASLIGSEEINVYQKGYFDALRSVACALGISPSSASIWIHRADESAVSERVHSHAVDPATVRAVLKGCFTASELRRFCQDRPAFRSILDRCHPNLALDDMVDVTIEFCTKRNLIAELLQGIETWNPDQYRLIISGHVE